MHNVSCSNASYGVYTYYNGSLNGTDSNVYYLINFDDLLRSYGECVCMCVRGGEGGNDGRRYIGSERAWEGGSNIPKTERTSLLTNNHVHTLSPQSLFLL